MTVLASSNSAETMVSGHIRYSAVSGVLMVVALVWVTR